VGDRASEHASEGSPCSPCHDARGKACLCDIHPIALQ
jgi:hypothetical protein